MIGEIKEHERITVQQRFQKLRSVQDPRVMCINTSEYIDLSPSRPRWEGSAWAHSPMMARLLQITDTRAAVEGFPLSRRGMGCADSTLKIYADNLTRLERAVASDLAACALQTFQRYLGDLRETTRADPRSTTRTLRTFLSWCVKTGILSVDAMAGVKMRPPADPGRRCRAPAVHGVPAHARGRRNAAILAVLARGREEGEREQILPISEGPRPVALLLP